jgi:hypothetical protein
LSHRSSPRPPSAPSGGTAPGVRVQYLSRFSILAQPEGRAHSGSPVPRRTLGRPPGHRGARRARVAPHRPNRVRRSRAAARLKSARRCAAIPRTSSRARSPPSIGARSVGTGRTAAGTRGTGTAAFLGQRPGRTPALRASGRRPAPGRTRVNEARTGRARGARGSSACRPRRSAWSSRRSSCATASVNARVRVLRRPTRRFGIAAVHVRPNTWSRRSAYQVSVRSSIPAETAHPSRQKLHRNPRTGARPRATCAMLPSSSATKQLVCTPHTGANAVLGSRSQIFGAADDDRTCPPRTGREPRAPGKTRLRCEYRS